MANADDTLLRDAIIGTEKEIFGDAFGKEDLTLDETGDRSLEAMGDGLEGQVEPPEDEDDGEDHVGPDDSGPEDEGEAHFEDTADAKAKADAETKTEDAAREQQGRVPPGRLREETRRAQAAEQRASELQAKYDAEKAEADKRFAELNSKLEMLATLQRPQNAAPKPEPVQTETPPDLFENPTAFVEHLKTGFNQQIAAVQKQMHDQRVNLSLESAKARYGETFDNAFKALKSLDFKDPQNRELAIRFENAPNPGDAIVSWHRRNETLREVGEDPAVYKARVAEEARKALAADPEFRKQLLNELRGEAMTGDNGRIRTETRLPKSLNRTPGGNTRAPNDLDAFDGSDRATFDSAFSN